MLQLIIAGSYQGEGAFGDQQPLDVEQGLQIVVLNLNLQVLVARNPVGPPCLKRMRASEHRI